MDFAHDSMFVMVHRFRHLDLLHHHLAIRVPVENKRIIAFLKKILNQHTGFMRTLFRMSRMP